MILPKSRPNLQPDIEKLVSNIQPKNCIRPILSLCKNKKIQFVFVFFFIVSAEVSFKNYIAAPHALQQTKSGPRSKKVGNHWCRALGEYSFFHLWLGAQN